jgi:hypothetical protein
MHNELKMKLLLLILAATFITCGCFRSNDDTPGTPISLERSIEIAKTAATARGYKIEEFDLQYVLPDTTDGNKQPYWSLLFVGTNGVMGNQFMVNVGKLYCDVKIFDRW